MLGIIQALVRQEVPFVASSLAKQHRFQQLQALHIQCVVGGRRVQYAQVLWICHRVALTNAVHLLL